MGRRRTILASASVVLVLLGGCRTVDQGSAAPGSGAPGSVTPSLATATPTAEPSPPGFGDILALRELLGSAGFRAGLSPQGYVTLASGPSVLVTLTPNGTDLGQFQAITLEVAPLSALDDDPTARPAVDLVLELFDAWSPDAAERTRRSLRDLGTTTSREGGPERQERTESDTADGFRLVTELSYGGPSEEDDYFRAILTRR